MARIEALLGMILIAACTICYLEYAVYLLLKANPDIKKTMPALKKKPFLQKLKTAIEKPKRKPIIIDEEQEKVIEEKYFASKGWPD